MRFFVDHSDGRYGFRVGCVVYTGRDTKLALNSKLTTNKFSTVERFRFQTRTHFYQIRIRLYPIRTVSYYMDLAFPWFELNGGKVRLG